MNGSNKSYPFRFEMLAEIKICYADSWEIVDTTNSQIVIMLQHRRLKVKATENGIIFKRKSMIQSD